MRTDETTTDSVWLATFYEYLGYPVLKVEGFTNRDVRWTFAVPACDAEISQQELNDPETSVLVQSWVQSFKRVQGLQRIAKEHNGVWTSPAYAQVPR